MSPRTSTVSQRAGRRRRVRCRTVEGQLDDAGDAQAGDQLRRRAARDHLAVVEDGDAVAEPLRLVHVVGGEQTVPPLPP